MTTEDNIALVKYPEDVGDWADVFLLKIQWLLLIVKHHTLITEDSVEGALHE